MKYLAVTLRATAAVLLLMLAACHSLPGGTGEELQRNVRDYNRMQRWQEGGEAVTRFVPPRHQPDYLRRAGEGHSPHIVDYRVGPVSWQTPGSVAVVPVEVDYYLPPSVTVKTIVDKQEWSYAEGQGWKITSPPPEFR